MNALVSFLAHLKSSLYHSWISLVTLVIILILAGTGQGDALLINLLDGRWVNLLFLFVLLDGLSMALSHYPVYIEMLRNRNIAEGKEIRNTRWKIDYCALPKWLQKPLYGIERKTGLGFITYTEDFDFPIKKVFEWTRYVLGAMLFLAMGYLCFTIIDEVNFSETKHALDFTLICVFVIFLLFFIVTLWKKRLSEKIKSGISGQYDPNLKNIQRIRYVLGLVFLASWIFRIVALFVCSNGWNDSGIWIFPIVLSFDFIKFTCYRLFRKFVRFKTYKLQHFNIWIGDHTIFIMTIVGIGLFAFGVVMWAHYIPSSISTLVIILSYLLLYYGAIILPTKLWMYHSYKSENSQIRKFNYPRLYTRGIPLFFLTFILWSIANTIWFGNDLHQLENANDKYNSVSEPEFIHELNNRFDSTGRDTAYFISAYGGGLKANAWNMLLLNELTDLNGKNILDKTIAISGVSGGSLGQGFFAAIYNESNDKYERNQMIHKVISQDYLSVDTVHFLGYDLIREYWPGSHFFGRKWKDDRAKRAMKKYAQTINDSIIEKSFRAHYASIFRTKKFPLIISNSAGTHHKRGLASSVDFGSNFHNIFHDATDIIDSLNSNLTYPEAFSPSNRFPLISPAAKIEGKGHFVDGGYYENSGMMSIIDIYEYLNNSSDFRMPKTVYFIQVMNSRSDYVHHSLSKRQDFENNEISESGEIAAILNTKVSMDMVPRYFLQKIESFAKDTCDGKHFIKVHLPYDYNANDVASLFKMNRFNESDLKSIKMEIDKNRDKLSPIIENTKFKYLTPPLARVLSQPAINYMDTVLKISNVLWKS